MDKRYVWSANLFYFNILENSLFGIKVAYFGTYIEKSTLLRIVEALKTRQRINRIIVQRNKMERIR